MPKPLRRGLRALLALAPALALALVTFACSEDSSNRSSSTGGSAAVSTGGGAGAAFAGNGGAAASVTVEPVESTELFANPGMGWQTFHNYADSDPSLDGLPSGSAYFRFTWKELEPTDGAIDPTLVAGTLQKARAAGQSLMFRVMTAGSDDGYTPTWLEAAGCKVFNYEYAGAALIAPDLDDPTCWARFEKLMTALGQELGTEPDLQVDIGGVGLWGEWHFSDTTPQVPMPSLETRKKVVDLHLALFPNSPHSALIGDVEALAYATGKGTGWRADCLGDLGFFSPTWNHMENMYKQNLQAAGAENAWQKGPVAWESCGTMQDWVDKGFDVHFIFQYGLDLHGSFVNNKSVALPPGTEYRSEVEWLLQTLGYRLVLRSLTHPKTIKAGGTLPLTLRWDNLGVAPPYHPFVLKLRLTPPAGSGASEVVLDTTADLRTWLPGTTDVEAALPLPSSMPAGTWALSVGISGTPGLPMLRLAIEGRDADGWYPVSKIVLE